GGPRRGGGARCRVGPRWRSRPRGSELDGHRGYWPDASFSTARRRAEAARRLAATSIGVGFAAPERIRRTVATAAHTQGRPDGQVQPPVAAGRKRALTIR